MTESMTAAAEGPGEAPRDLRREFTAAMRKCTPKQRVWLRALPDNNFQRWSTALKLGISRNSIFKWLRLETVKAVLTLHDEIATEDYDISNRRILAEYTRIAFSDIREAFDDSGKLKSPSEWSDELAAAIGAVDTQEKRLKENGEWVDEFEMVRKLKVHDKLKALEFLSDFRRMSGAKKFEVTGKNGEPLASAPPIIQFVERAD